MKLVGSDIDDAAAPGVLAARAWQAEKAAAGYGWITGPRELGGTGLPSTHQLAFSRLEAQFDVPDPTSLVMGLHLLRPTVAAWGHGELPNRVCRAFTNGEILGCQLFSESEAGSDLAALRTTASREGDVWRVTGQKLWSSIAHIADVGLLLCRTGDEADRHRNLTMFLIDMDTPGIDVRRIRQMTGEASFNEVTFDDVYVPDDRRLGEVDGGWKVAMSTISSERSAIGGGQANNPVDVELLVEMVRRFGAGDDVTRDLLAQALIAIRVADAFNARCTEEMLSGSFQAPVASVAKLLMISSVRKVAGLVDHVLGQRAVADTGEWGTYAWRMIGLEISAYSVGGGSDEIQRNAVAERVLGLPR
ncbi:acyl-CoA dehydrogenase family protein [Georgenia sp. SYP-B2076]|uniref:acyl-CoA dehydrogenase family protein n=1 Tax=Georgenia sp. SYP-B2076 TaxID=2495881 RepID=UPI000F8E5DCF|nr:acyl-CoA dehydrogenase family protein [Georgenia sp. SYP-B2076]